MSVILCQHCDTKQPPYWQGGDLCAGCGKLPRNEIHCGWCTAQIPAGKFCRECGFKQAEPREYPVVRMLKQEGVDKFNLHQTLESLDQDYRDFMHQRYNEQLAIMQPHIEVMLVAQKYLVHQHYASDLAQQLIAQLPLSSESLSRYEARYPTGVTDAELLRAAEEVAPEWRMQKLCLLAMLRTQSQQMSPQIVNQLILPQLSDGEDQSFREEVLALFGDWRMPYTPDIHGGIRKWLSDTLASCESVDKHPGFATAALFYDLARDEDQAFNYQRIVREALTNTDQNIRLSAAIALDEERLLAEFAERGNNVALACLANLGSEQLLPIIKSDPRRISALNFGSNSGILPLSVRQFLLDQWFTTEEQRLQNVLGYQLFGRYEEWVDTELLDYLVKRAGADCAGKPLEQARMIVSFLCRHGANVQIRVKHLEYVAQHYSELSQCLMQALLEAFEPFASANDVEDFLFGEEGSEVLTDAFLALYPELDREVLSLASRCPPRSPYLLQFNDRIARFLEGGDEESVLASHGADEWKWFYRSALKNHDPAPLPVYRSLYRLAHRSHQPELALEAFHILIYDAHVYSENGVPYRSEDGQAHLFNLGNPQWVQDCFDQADGFLHFLIEVVTSPAMREQLEPLTFQLRHYPGHWQAALREANAQTVDQLLEAFLLSTELDNGYGSPLFNIEENIDTVRALFPYLNDYKRLTKRLLLVGNEALLHECLNAWAAKSPEDCEAFCEEQEMTAPVSANSVSAS